VLPAHYTTLSRQRATGTATDTPSVSLPWLGSGPTAARKRPAARRDCRCPRVRHRHGTRGAYLRDRCGCAECRAAHAAHQRAHRRRRGVHVWYGTSAWADATGTRRRLQALSAAGWSTSQLAERLGVTKSAIAQLRSTGQSRVLASTATDVAALYDACWWRTPPGLYQARCERYAERRGWIGPWRWDGLDIDDPTAAPPPDVIDQLDPVALAQLLDGRRVVLNRAERRAAVAELHRRGLTAAAIAERVGLSTRTIERYLAVARAAGEVRDAA
jgi:transcriptional regulator with XRE-family HTH domain